MTANPPRFASASDSGVAAKTIVAVASPRPCRELSGAPLATRKVPGFEISEREYPAGLAIPRHAHATAHLVFGIEGTYSESHGTRTIMCPPGVLRYLPRGVEHSNVFDSGARCLIVSIESHTLDRVAGHANLCDQLSEVRSPASAWLVQRLCSEFRRNDTLALVSLEGILLEILADCARYALAPGATPAVPRWLRSAREYVESNFLRSLSLAEIAQTAGVHRVHLAREFRRHFSMTVGEYLRRKRVEHACRLVSTTRDSLADVAVACGFSDQSHFCATFRHHIGLTPGRFREMVQSQ